MKIILGSSSKYRQAVLAEAGYKFESLSPDIDEKSIRTKNYNELPRLIAKAKQEALLKRFITNSVLITADQVVVCDGHLHEKPANAKEAELFLQRYSDGYPAQTISALSLYNTRTRKSADGIDVARIYFKPIPKRVIRKFISEGDPFSVAGGFSIESPILKPYIRKIEGTRDSVFGMPLNLFMRLYAKVRD